MRLNSCRSGRCDMARTKNLTKYDTGRILHDGEMCMNGTVIVYREHVTQDVLDMHLEDMGIKIARSPLHDRDAYTKASVTKWERNHPDPSEDELARKPVVGEFKKPHWHCTFQLSGRRGLRHILALFPDELGVTSVFRDPDPERAIRYLCHLDSPKKAQYAIADCEGFGGIDLSPLEKLSKLDKVNVIAVICNHINDDKVTNFFDLSNWVMDQGDVEMFDSLVSKTAFFTNYMNGMLKKLSNRAIYKDLED